MSSIHAAAARIQDALILLGDYTLFLGDNFRRIGKVWKRRGLFLKQCEFIGVSSMPVVSVAAIFMGAVLAYQLYLAFHRFGAEGLMGGAVGVAFYKELGPVMTAVMVIGRAGAAMAAEIASMKLSEQVDALEVMAVDPVEYLTLPRIAAGIVMMPLLSIFFSAIASVSAATVASSVMGMSSTVFWNHYSHTMDTVEIWHCLIKGGAFGFVLATIGCFNGLRAYGGARAVGLSTRNTVVASCLCVLLVDYFLTSLLPPGFSKLKVL